MGLWVVVTEPNNLLGFNPSVSISPMIARKPAKALVLETPTFCPLNRQDY